jgi:hypothetical protein
MRDIEIKNLAVLWKCIVGCIFNSVELIITCETQMSLEMDQIKMIGSIDLYYCCDILLQSYFDQLKSLKRDHVTHELYRVLLKVVQIF